MANVIAGMEDDHGDYTPNKYLTSFMNEEKRQENHPSIRDYNGKAPFFVASEVAFLETARYVKPPCS